MDGNSSAEAAAVRHDLDALDPVGRQVVFGRQGDHAADGRMGRATARIGLQAGIGGTPEGIITAAAIRCMGGAIQAQLAPTDEAERRKALDAGHDVGRDLDGQGGPHGDEPGHPAAGHAHVALPPGGPSRWGRCRPSRREPVGQQAGVDRPVEVAEPVGQGC